MTPSSLLAENEKSVGAMGDYDTVDDGAALKDSHGADTSLLQNIVDAVSDLLDPDSSDPGDPLNSVHPPNWNPPNAGPDPQGDDGGWDDHWK